MTDPTDKLVLEALQKMRFALNYARATDDPDGVAEIRHARDAGEAALAALREKQAGLPQQPDAIVHSVSSASQAPTPPASWLQHLEGYLACRVDEQDWQASLRAISRLRGILTRAEEACPPSLRCAAGAPRSNEHASPSEAQ